VDSGMRGPLFFGDGNFFIIVHGGIFFGSVAISALLYRVSLYYQLEKERA
jgi:hypothetical protein